MCLKGAEALFTGEIWLRATCLKKLNTWLVENSGYNDCSVGLSDMADGQFRLERVLQWDGFMWQLENEMAYKDVP